MEREMPKLQEETHISGSYIQSLVKQLSSSNTKENPKSSDDLSRELTKLSEALGEAQRQPQPQSKSQPKKQVRRRLHTTKPYQKRLLNMAEARREVVTALKFHRAAMNQANEQQQQAQPPPPPTCPPPLKDTHQDLMDSMRNTRIYQARSKFPNYYHNLTFSWAHPPIAPLPVCGNHNLPLPDQPLGLNLDFQGFNNIETSIYTNNRKPSIQPSLASPSSSGSSSYSCSSPSLPTMLGIEVPLVSNELVGVQHEIDWNDTMNVATLDWWCKFLNSMEVGSEEKGIGKEGDGSPILDGIMEIPEWLSDRISWDANESCLLEQHMDDFHPEDYLQDTTLPCLDIGETEGLDGGDWLS